MLEQDYPNLEYIVIDGGSTDGSVDVIKKYMGDLAFWVSEKDEGMYQAINKGFDRSTGDIMCWINSDDILWADSLAYVGQTFADTGKNIHWLQGYPSVIDENGQLMYQREPVSSKWRMYNHCFAKDGAFIQQESTFWTRELWNRAGARLNTDYSLAADFDLWMQFFHYEKLFCSHRKLGAFRKRAGQKSADREGYIGEAKESVRSHRKKLTFSEKLKLRYFNDKGNVNWID